MTRSKRFVEAEDEESGMHKKKAAEKKGVEGKSVRSFWLLWLLFDDDNDC